MIASFPTSPIPENVRLGRTLLAWKAAILAYAEINGASKNGHRPANATTSRVSCQLP